MVTQKSADLVYFLIQVSPPKGPSIKYVSIFEGVGVLKMLTVADIRGRGISKVLTSAHFANKSNNNKYLLTKS